MLSVIVPCFNYGRYLEDSIYSLIGGETSLGTWHGQGGAVILEIIIVDDASTDDSAEIALGLAASDDRISFVRHIENQGTAVTYNTGTEAASGEFITILSADDMRACDSKHGAVAYDDIRDFADGQRLGIRHLPGHSKRGVVRHNILHAGIVMPREAWIEVGGYPAIMADGREEWAMGIALTLTGRPVVHVPRPGYLYRQEGQNRSLTNSDRGSTKTFLCQLVKLYPEAFQDLEPTYRRGQTSRADWFYQEVQRCQT